MLNLEKVIDNEGKQEVIDKLAEDITEGNIRYIDFTDLR